MRQQAMENLLKLFEKVVDEGMDENTLKNLAAKSSILRDRDNKNASVSCELVNMRV